jgi:hypothetical protein
VHNVACSKRAHILDVYSVLEEVLQCVEHHGAVDSLCCDKDNRISHHHCTKGPPSSGAWPRV